MKRVITTILILFFFRSTSYAASSKKKYHIGKGWTKEHTIYQSIYTAFHVIDWGQTKHIVRQKKTYETNMILGKYPSLEKVDIYFGSTLFLHTFISYALPPSCRKTWQLVWIGLETGTVTHNFSMGVKLNF